MNIYDMQIQGHKRIYVQNGIPKSFMIDDIGLELKKSDFSFRIMSKIKRSKIDILVSEIMTYYNKKHRDKNELDFIFYVTDIENYDFKNIEKELEETGVIANNIFILFIGDIDDESLYDYTINFNSDDLNILDVKDCRTDKIIFQIER